MTKETEIAPELAEGNFEDVLTAIVVQFKILLDAKSRHDAARLEVIKCRNDFNDEKDSFDAILQGLGEESFEILQELELTVDGKVYRPYFDEGDLELGEVTFRKHKVSL